MDLKANFSGMQFNPKKHRRRSIRLSEYDYTRAGAYFVTLCVQNRECLFGNVVDGVMRLNDAGRMADEFIQRLPERFSGVTVDCHQVMPNHLHAVLMIADNVGSASDVGVIHELPLQPDSRSDRMQYEKWRSQRRRMMIPKCVGFFRMNTAKWINQLRRTPGTRVWQRNYHEHIIRNQRSLERIRQYIVDNPKNWGRDRNNPARSA